MAAFDDDHIVIHCDLEGADLYDPVIALVSCSTPAESRQV